MVTKSAENQLLSPGSEASWRASHQLAADGAKGDALNWMGTALALGGGFGALRGLYESHNRRKALEKQQNELRLTPPPVPLVATKSASRHKMAGWGDLLAGNHAHSYGAAAVPWAVPGTIAALFGGHALGKGLVNRASTGNIEEDLKAERQKKKQEYLQAAQAAAHPAAAPPADVLPMQKAAEFSPSGLDRWGPEVGVGAGALGGLGLFQLMRHYNTTRNAAKQKEIEEKDKALSQATESLRLPLQPVPTAPIRFAG